MFITFEGVEGSGKTSVLKELILRLSSDYPGLVITTREPGGTKISEQIRHIILDKDNHELDSRAEALLFAAARRQHIKEVLLPARQAGKIILCDRYIDSSLVYQGVARNIGIKEVYKVNLFATEGFMPDLTLLFDIEPEKGMERIAKNQHREVNRLDLEKLDFHKKIREAFLALANSEASRFVVIDAAKPFLEVIETSYQVIKTRLTQHGY
ncbi:MAG: dTMP kinase [Erysipelotrichaceae bacterium]|jgi:dTMP kinase|nr:dTMP kinase [Erysipelotrichaceae bacterium]